MDVARADSGSLDDASARPRGLGGWLDRAQSNEAQYRYALWGCGILLVTMLGYSLSILQRDADPTTLLSPLQIAGLLIANLVPAIALMVLLSRKIATARAERGEIGTGRLHTRLVALFSVIAAVPTVLVAIFASLLFQSGLEFWFSDRARTMLENTVVLARSAYDREVERVSGETIAMATDVAGYLREVAIDDPMFAEAFGRNQVYRRGLSEAVIFTVNPSDKVVRTLALVNPYDRPMEKVINPATVAELGNKEVVPVNSSDRVGAVVRLDYGPNSYLYASRVFNPELKEQIDRGNAVLADYQSLLKKSRTNQVNFNLALLIGAIVIVALAIFAALRLADRLLRPVGELVGAAGRIEEGDLSARVTVSPPADEIAMLGTAFNRMTERLQAQTGALISANAQLDTRRAFIEAVLSSVTAGVLAIDAEGRVVLTNRSAETLLHRGEAELEGLGIADISPELGEFWSGEARDANVIVATDDGQRTLAVKRMRYADGGVMTFDDITDQLSDQRRAAWSDIARRIAHEIKNPLTPIQLAAERLQRRYGGEIGSDPETFARLTETIVRQVGDLRRMVDEFSNFARMPKPVFREENVHDIARAALFLHEVAHPGIIFALEPARGPMPMVCDRRQLGQALTNIVKNAVEAIEARRNRGDSSPHGDRVDMILRREGGTLVIDVLDTGVGLPEDRERLTEPYVTTRVRGTGLGLAIVKKIVEEHLGEIAFLDRRDGGTHVRVAFDAERLSMLAGPIEERPVDDDFSEEEA